MASTLAELIRAPRLPALRAQRSEQFERGSACALEKSRFALSAWKPPPPFFFPVADAGRARRRPASSPRTARSAFENVGRVAVRFVDSHGAVARYPKIPTALRRHRAVPTTRPRALISSSAARLRASITPAPRPGTRLPLDRLSETRAFVAIPELYVGYRESEWPVEAPAPPLSPIRYL